MQLVDLRDAAAPEHPDTFEGLRFNVEAFDGINLHGSTFTECEFTGVSMNDTELRGARFLECRSAGLYAPVFRAARTTFRDVVLEGSRLGSAEMYDSSWTSVHVDGGKLDFLNLRNARLNNVLFTGCIIGELDLGGAKAARVAFSNCRIDSLNLSGAALTDVDLRTTDFGSITHLPGLGGATIDDHQLRLLAPLLAQNLGLRVEDG